MTQEMNEKLSESAKKLGASILLSFEPNTKSASFTKGSVTVKQDNETLHVDILDIATDKQRVKFVNKLIEKYSGLAKCKEQLQKQMMELANEHITKNQKEKEKQNTEGENQPLAKSKIALDNTRRKNSELIDSAEELLKSPDLIEKVISDAHTLGVAGEDKLIAAIYLIGTSRLLTKPLAGLIMGQSSGGKSYITKKVAELFPEEAVLKAHSISPKALPNMEPGSLIHRFVVAGERSRLQDDKAAEATRSLREMISDNELSTLVSASQMSGPNKTVHIKQKGPIAYVENTTLGIKEIFNEDRTRFIPLSVDESQEQSAAVIKQTARSTATLTNPDNITSIIELHHTAQRLLKPFNVVVPFAEKLEDCFPMKRIEVRRTFVHLMSLIKAVALLYQFQRRICQGQILANRDDYDIVRKYLTDSLATSLGCELTPGAKDLLNAVRSMGEEEFTISDLVGKVSYGPTAIRSRLKELESVGQVHKTEEARGRSPSKYVVSQDPPALNGFELPDLKSLIPPPRPRLRFSA